MSATAAVAAIKARLVANWTTTPIAWPREAFTPPVGDGATLLPWVHFDPDTSLRNRIGVSPVYDGNGRVLLEVLSPTNTGYEGAAALRDALSQIFSDALFSGLWTEVEEDNSDSGLSDNGGYSVSFIAIRWREWAGA